MLSQGAGSMSASPLANARSVNIENENVDDELDQNLSGDDKSQTAKRVQFKSGLA